MAWLQTELLLLQLFTRAVEASDVQRLAWAQYSAEHLLARQLVSIDEASCVRSCSRAVPVGSHGSQAPTTLSLPQDESDLQR